MYSWDGPEQGPEGIAASERCLLLVGEQLRQRHAGDEEAGKASKAPRSKGREGLEEVKGREAAMATGPGRCRARPGWRRWGECAGK